MLVLLAASPNSQSHSVASSEELLKQTAESSHQGPSRAARPAVGTSRTMTLRESVDWQPKSERVAVKVSV